MLRLRLAMLLRLRLDACGLERLVRDAQRVVRAPTLLHLFQELIASARRIGNSAQIDE